MSLKSRLSRLQTQAGSGSAFAAPNPAASGLRNRLAQLRPERLHAQPTTSAHTMSAGELARSLEGELIDDGLIHINKRLPLTGEFGAIGLHTLREHPRLPGVTGSDGRRCVYLDTETTGLSGGSGTLAFLIGLAVVEGGAIELKQFLMTKFSAESALLSACAGTLTPDDHLVSYNGKSYDLPLLISRCRMQALAHPFAGLPHLDLLYPVRRLFGNRWSDCRLPSLEQNLLGFTRVDDLPGSEAPAAWFGYVRSGHDRQLTRVVEHNRQDILSLAIAHTALSQAIAQPRAFGVDIHALARWLAETSEAEARELLQSHADNLCDDGKRLLGHLARRAGDWPQAVALWKALAAGGCTDSLERLAKYHEHISKDLAAARRCCDGLPGNAAREHRRRRIEGKLHKQQPHPRKRNRRCDC